MVGVAGWVSVKEVVGRSAVPGWMGGFEIYEEWKGGDDHAHKAPCMWEDKEQGGWGRKGGTGNGR